MKTLFQTMLVLIISSWLLFAAGCKNDNINNLQPDPVKDIDGNTYKIVKIGNQWWMAENLKTTKYNDGTPIPNETDDDSWVTLSSGAYCWYDNDYIVYGSVYGALYNGFAVATGNLCPIGWHVPSDQEWKTMEIFLGMTQEEADDTGPRGAEQGIKMKEAGTTHWGISCVGATNSTGFTALPGGSRSYGYFYYIRFYGYWWSSIASSTSDAWTRGLHCTYNAVNRLNGGKEFGLSVRCVRDH